MKIAIGSDHAGFELKQKVAELLRAQGREVADLGTYNTESCDYPDFAAAVGRAVASGAAGIGVLVCSTGVGVSIAANKIDGIRAALAVSLEGVRLTRQHNDANILCLGAKYTDVPAAAVYLDAFLNTPFDGGRHERRVNKIAALEQKSR